MKNIHVLSTDKPSRLWIWMDELRLGNLTEQSKSLKISNQNIYITNYEGSIKKGEYAYITDNAIWKCEGFPMTELNCLEKVILTTDQDLIKDGVQAIDDEFLEWFVKNPSCDEVNVVDDWNSPRIDAYEYKIIIPKEEQTKCYCGHTTCCDCGPKQETLEEAAREYWKRGQFGLEKAADTERAFLIGGKWQQERSYSEEEVHHIIQMYSIESYDIGQNITYDEWFEQFKKK